MKKEDKLPVSKKLQDAFELCQEVCNGIFGFVKDPKDKRKLIPKVSVVLDRDCDDSILIDGWLYLMEADDITVPTFNGKTAKAHGWYMSYGWEDPGVRYHKDMSGTPPSWEVSDCDPATVQYLSKAIELLLCMLIKNEINNMIESRADEKMYREQEELEAKPEA